MECQTREQIRDPLIEHKKEVEYVAVSSEGLYAVSPDVSASRTVTLKLNSRAMT